jgi:hypothetical protein
MLAVIASNTSENLAARVETRSIAPRFDMYRGIHKALRACMGETLAALGAMDPDDPPAAARALAQLRDCLDLLAVHLDHEETYVIGAIERRRPGAAAGNARDHIGHERELRELAEMCAQLELAVASGSPDRMTDAHRLYLAFADFVAENFVHMANEERHMNAILWSLFSDDELHAIEGAIIASQSPQESMRGLRWIFPSITPAERAAMALGARATMPPQAFGPLVAFVRTLLSPDDQAKLDDALAR